MKEPAKTQTGAGSHSRSDDQEGDQTEQGLKRTADMDQKLRRYPSSLEHLACYDTTTLSRNDCTWVCEKR